MNGIGGRCRGGLGSAARLAPKLRARFVHSALGKVLFVLFDRVRSIFKLLVDL